MQISIGSFLKSVKKTCFYSYNFPVYTNIKFVLWFLSTGTGKSEKDNFFLTWMLVEKCTNWWNRAK